MRQKLWKLSNFKIKPFLRKLKDDPLAVKVGVCCQLWCREYIGVMLNMDQESRDNNGNKSDMRPASKFQGLRIKFHHLWPHIFLPYPLDAMWNIESYFIFKLSQSIALWNSCGRGWGRFDFIPKWTEGNRYHLYFNPSMGREEGAGK